ncbi:hypothetical protein SNEBB_004782 [Seison nebaliae]|nr:hypothetical protein SNEBB_004782 [Seison nebaliae]
MKVFPAATESMIFEKTLLERSSLERFNTVLNDVISVEPLDVSGHLYRYIYYPKIRVLNVEFELENVQHDPIHITSFQSCYYNDIDHSIINNLNDEMVKRKIRPKVIQIAFHEKPIMRIHERTFFKFSQFLSRLKGEGILNAPPPDFSVFLQTQRFTMPRINEETIYFPFPTDIGEKNYELKAISFRIYQEFELLMSHIPPIIHESSTVKNCVEKFRAKTVSYLDSSEIKILIFLYAYMEKYIGYFNTICLTVLDNEKHSYLLCDIMDPKEFHRLTTMEKWTHLNELPAATETGIVGFQNDCEIGCCQTNVIFAMIMSSVHIMRTIRKEIEDCSPACQTAIENSAYYSSNLEGEEKDSMIRNVLGKGLRDAIDNVRSRTALALPINYCVVKGFTAEEKRIITNSPDRVLEHIDPYLLWNPSPFTRFHEVLQDSLTVEPEVYDVLQESQFRYIFYPKINALNVELSFANVQRDPITADKFTEDYYNVIRESTINPLRDQLKKEGIKPKTIFMGFTESADLRIHERTYSSFASFLDIISHSAPPPPRFMIYFEIQRFSAPILRENHGLSYPFPTRDGNTYYKLKGITYRMIDPYEHERMHNQWAYLKGLGHVTPTRVTGFYNDNAIGCCQTNVIFSMLIASETVLDIIQNRMDTCPAAMKDHLRRVGYLSNNIVDGEERQTEVLYVLSKGLCDAVDGQLTKGGLNLAPHYCVSKAFTFEEKEQVLYTPNLLSPFSRKYAPAHWSPHERLNTVLLDLLPVATKGNMAYTPNQMNYRSMYYCELRIFSLDLSLHWVNSDVVDPIKFDENYYDHVSYNIMIHLRNYIIVEKLKPQTIQISFQEATTLRVHERTYPEIVSFINTFIQFGIDASPIPGFIVFLEIQRFTMPNLVEGTDIYYPFPTDKGDDALYPLIGMTVRITDLHEIHITTIIDMIESDDIHVLVCVEKIRLKTKSYFHTNEEFQFLDQYFMKYFGYFQTLCAKIILNTGLYNTLTNKNNDMHTFAITKRNGKWRMMNDQYSFVIDNIQTLSEYLDNLVIDSVLLENNNIE